MRGRLGFYPLIALSVWALAACNDSGGDGNATGSQEASGASQKGPFRAGGEASAVLLAADGTADGDSVTGSIDEQGQYEIAGIDWSGPTRLRMSGTFFDEVAGNFSSDTRVLTAVVAIEDGGTPETNVNLFTHFEAERTTTLMAGGEPFDDALASARSDLQTALDISSDPGDLNLLQALDGLSEDSANLLLFSAAVQEGGIGQSGLDELAADFADDGQFNGQGADELSTILEKATDTLLADARTKLKNQYSTEPPNSTGGFGWKLSACAAAKLTEPRVFCGDETYEGTKFNDDGEEILYFPDTTGFHAFSLAGDVTWSANWSLHSDSLSGSEVGDASESDGDTTTFALDADDRYAFDLYLAGLADANDEFTLSGGPVSQGDAFDLVPLTVGEVHAGRVGYVFVNASQGNGPATSWYRFDSQGGEYRVRTSGYVADSGSGGLKIEIYEGDAGQETINNLGSLDQVDFVNGSGTSSNELTATLEAGKPHFVLITNLFTDYRRVNSPAESTGSVEFDLKVTRE